MRKMLSFAAIVVVLVFAASAAAPGHRAEAASDARAKAREAKLEKKRQAELKKLRILKDGEIYVVGRVELIPRLKEQEQSLKTGGSGRLKNKSYVFFSNKFIDITSQGMGLIGHAALAPLSETFVVKRRMSEPIYYSGALIMLESSASRSGYMNNRTTINQRNLYLPGDRIYTVKPGVKAVYVGTIRYYRDDYNAIKKVEHVDDYAKAEADFRKIIANPKISLYKAGSKKQKGLW